MKPVRHIFCELAFFDSTKGNCVFVFYAVFFACLLTWLGFTLLMSLGKLIHANKTALDLLEALQPALDPFIQSKVVKVQQVAKEVRLLINTPVA